MSTAGAQTAVPALSYCWPGRQPRPLVARIISSWAARRSSNRSQLVMGVIAVIAVMGSPLCLAGLSGLATRKNTAQVNTIQFRATLFTV